jgi:hypothetical protein
VELSDDQKKRILEEEHQRLAEEQYRAQVRQELQNRTAATNPTSPVVEPPKTPNQHDEPKHSTKTLLLILVIAGVVGLLWIGRSSMNSQSEPYAPSIFETKHTEKIGSGQFVVNAGKVFYYRIPVKDMRNIHITGHFLALGGQGNDIDVVLAEEKEFGLWMDGQQAKVYYQSGRATSGDIDVKLPALNATYYLAFNNRFSVLSAKTINADLSMSYSTVILK